jgi:hypothetical protein
MITKFTKWLGITITKLTIQAAINRLYRDRENITSCTPIDCQYKRLIDQDITQLESILQGLIKKTQSIPAPELPARVWRF